MFRFTKVNQPMKMPVIPQMLFIVSSGVIVAAVIVISTTLTASEKSTPIGNTTYGPNTKGQNSFQTTLETINTTTTDPYNKNTIQTRGTRNTLISTILPATTTLKTETTKKRCKVKKH